MSGADVAAAQGGSNNASEFVRKLFRMLEDPSHQDVARWGKDGDTFVVVEGEKFTRNILPKHFKHSNMSSFIRQLNKYDFHKVKPSSDTETTSALGNVLEFKHPYFRVDSKDDLDNIRRKAPAPRKPQVTEDFTTSQHISVISEQLTAQQQQVQQLQELFGEVNQTNRLLVNEVLTLQKMLNAQKQAQYEMLNYLAPYDESGGNGFIGHSMTSNGGVSANDSGETVAGLRKARELLGSVASDAVADRELERLQGLYASPTDSAALITPTMPLMQDPMNDIARYPIYPVGQTVGIDPFHSDNIHKIPYSLPQDVSITSLAEPPRPTAAPTTPTTSSGVEKPEMLWGPKKPLVFLVEDDMTCSRIGVKFLKSMGCEVELAQNGADAYTRMCNVGQDHFDLILMDIIMPRLDGLSATLYIRQHHPGIPIIAMTSNIRPEEVNGYFENGMNGVLAKPFTKDGMAKTVRDHLAHLLKNPPSHEHSNVGYMMNTAYLTTPGNLGPAGSAAKFDTPTPPSGTANTTWSPAQQMQPSPADQGYGVINGSNQYNMATRYTSMQGGDRQSENDSPPEKRQRLNPSQNTYA